ncbi:MAG: aminoacyl-tRNA hydrolase [Eubacteriales bacterium]|nr:aminoacyl-tRNA hydrolase [Eubacteriales bacterium]
MERTKIMFVIVGLGNPGKEYEKTRHNMGFMTLDVLAARSGIQISRHHFRAYFGEGFLGTKKVVLAKPDTFMNNSGWAVRDLVNWYKITPEELILIYDDADIPEGFIRVREGGSAGTHNGMRSVIYQLGFDDFPRVRIGIGSAQYDMIQHVLTMPQGESAVLLQKAIGDAADAVELIVAGALHEAQARYNRKPPKPPKPPKPDTDTNENDETAEPRA